MTVVGVRRAKAAFLSGCKSHPAMLLQPEAIGAVMEVTKWLVALGKRGRGGTRMSWRNLLLESSWCKSSPVKAVAGRPVASVAIRRATGGCEAYTASKQAVRISSEIFDYCDADAVQPAEGSIRPTVMRGGTGVAGVSSPGHAYQRTSREPRRAPCLSAVWA